MKQSDKAYIDSINKALVKRGSLNVRVSTRFGYFNDGALPYQLVEDKGAAIAGSPRFLQLPVYLFHNFDFPSYKIGRLITDIYKPMNSTGIVPTLTKPIWYFRGTYINGSDYSINFCDSTNFNPLIDASDFFNTITNQGDIFQLYINPVLNRTFWVLVVYSFDPQGSFSGLLSETDHFNFTVYDTMIESDNIAQYNNAIHLVNSQPDGKFSFDNLNPLAFKKATTADSQNFIRIDKPYQINRHTGLITKIDWLSTYINFQFNYKY